MSLPPFFFASASNFFEIPETTFLPIQNVSNELKNSSYQWSQQYFFLNFYILDQ